jgi:hypothetical protein
MARQGAWIDVYPLNGTEVSIKNTGARVRLSKELSDYCKALWAPKAGKGWKSSSIAFAKSLSVSPEGSRYEIEAGAMPFYVVDGMNKAIEGNKDFAPKQGYVNCLSVGFPVATSDSKIIFQRRAPDVHCPNILIHEPCGYMASMNFVPREECDLEKYADDSRLFDLPFQYEFRKNEIAKTFGISPELVSYNSKQDLLACGWLSTELYFSTTGKISATEKELTIPEKGEFFFVPFEYLKELIYNQGKLSQINAEGYRPSDPREIPLIDESTIGLIYGYEKLTGEKLDIEETIERLNHNGMNIRVYDTSFGWHYEFPTSF